MVMAYKIRSLSNEFVNLSPALKHLMSPFLAHAPTKLGGIANALNIDVFVGPLSRHISGKITRKDQDFTIKINKYDSPHRKRFTLAHELSHFLLHKDILMQRTELEENALLRSGLPSAVEYEANRLASDLVMPPNLIALLLGSDQGHLNESDLEQLAKKLGVSKPALQIRLSIS